MSDVHPLQLLRPLGATPDEIAHSLEQQGVKGRPRCADDCALIVFLEGCGLRSIESDAVYLTWNCGDDSAMLPEEFQEFAHRFDEGKYPALVRA